MSTCCGRPCTSAPIRGRQLRVGAATQSATIRRPIVVPPCPSMNDLAGAPRPCQSPLGVRRGPRPPVPVCGAIASMRRPHRTAWCKLAHPEREHPRTPPQEKPLADTSDAPATRSARCLLPERLELPFSEPGLCLSSGRCNGRERQRRDATGASTAAARGSSFDGDRFTVRWDSCAAVQTDRSGNVGPPP